MAERTWCTTHSNFRIKKENILGALEAICKWQQERDELEELPGYEGLSFALLSEGLEISESDHTGDVIDLYLHDEYWDESMRYVCKVIAPFVEPGSYVVFFGGGIDAVWGVTWERGDDGVMHADPDADLEVIAHPDLIRLIRLAERTDYALYEEMIKKYGHLFHEEDKIRFCGSIP